MRVLLTPRQPRRLSCRGRPVDVLSPESAVRSTSARGVAWHRMEILLLQASRRRLVVDELARAPQGEWKGHPFPGIDLDFAVDHGRVVGLGHLDLVVQCRLKILEL